MVSEVAAGPDRAALYDFAARRTGAPPGALRLEVRPLRGGLEAAGVARVEARWRDRRGKPHLSSFVVKRLAGEPAREAVIYERLVALQAAELAPSLLGVTWTGDASCLLFLERIRPRRAWPWRETATARRVLERLAHLHTTLEPGPAAPVLTGWDYERELLAASREPLELLVRQEDLAGLRRSLPALRRVIAALPQMRRQLLAFAPFGCAVIHGDVHPGNAMIRASARPVLLDWGRARIGSPLEDVSSWLQSLGYWEPEAKRRHDTLLVAYLSARGLPGLPDRELRDAYWLAGASNVLAGALAYHLWGASGDPRHRDTALRAAADCLRVIRRADACWRG